MRILIKGMEMPTEGEYRMTWRECEQAHKLELPVTHWMPLPEPPKED